MTARSTGWAKVDRARIRVPDIMYGYDMDGDGGQTPGYFGGMLLGHTVRLGMEGAR